MRFAAAIWLLFFVFLLVAGSFKKDFVYVRIIAFLMAAVAGYFAGYVDGSIATKVQLYKAFSADQSVGSIGDSNAVNASVEETNRFRMKLDLSTNSEEANHVLDGTRDKPAPPQD